jgi:hypothetical protein
MRVESKLVHAELSLLAAVDMVERAELHELLPDLMIRRSYVAHELNRPERALSLAESATLGYARVGNREGDQRDVSVLHGCLSRSFTRSGGDSRAVFDAAAFDRGASSKRFLLAGSR